MSWRFLPYERLMPEWNMAIDEAILLHHSQGRVPPTLRFYGWKIPTLSVGYFQSIKREIDLEKVKERKVGLVRRLTGGRAVLHDQELTYSIVVSEQSPYVTTSVSESYRYFSLGLLKGFQILGIPADLASKKRGRDRDSSAICFAAPSDYEVVVEGKKAVGSAQVRQNGVVLQHGSILLNIDLSFLFSLFLFSSPQDRETAMKQFQQQAVAIGSLLKRPVVIEEVSEAFYRGFEEGMGIRFSPGQLTKEEWNTARELVHTKYSQESWNYRR